MTTIAIIGGGIAARSLLYVMAKKKFQQKILVFYSDSFAFPCSLHSTAIVAPRGVSTGHSALGDNLHDGFLRFSRHVGEDSPAGVIKIPQYTGALTKLDAFKKRYPSGENKKSLGPFSFPENIYFAEESAYLIRPREYMDWLLSEASHSLDLEILPSYVTEVSQNEIKTQEGKRYSADTIVFAAGVQNDLWKGLFSEDKKSKSVQGSYLEFSNFDLGQDSLSLTLEGNNLIYDAQEKSVLIGSTTQESALELAPEKELHEIFEKLRELTGVKFPVFSSGLIRVGLREKASKREPYIIHNGQHSMLGGFYKNGYSLSLTMAEKLLSSSAH